MLVGQPRSQFRRTEFRIDRSYFFDLGPGRITFPQLPKARRLNAQVAKIVQMPAGSVRLSMRAATFTPSPYIRSSLRVTSPGSIPMPKFIRRLLSRFWFSVLKVSWIAIAPMTASRALSNSTRTLSPGASTTRPLCLWFSVAIRLRKAVSEGGYLFAVPIFYGNPASRSAFRNRFSSEWFL